MNYELITVQKYIEGQKSVLFSFFSSFPII